MRNCIIIIVIIWSLSLYGCHRRESLVENIEKIVISDQDIDKEILLSDYVDFIEEITLETIDQSIIAQIDKTIICEDVIFIFDKKGKTIFKFSRNGQFICKLSAVSNGPGEYINPFDFDVCRKHIYLLDYTKKTLLIYDLEFNYEKTLRLNNFYTNVTVLDNQIVLYTGIYNPNDSYHLTVINETNEIIFEEFPYKDTQERKFEWTSGGGFCFAKQDEKSVFFSKTFNDTIYKITDHVEPFLSLDFSSNNTFSYDDINNINIFDPDKSCLFKYNFFSSKKLLICNVLKGGTPFFIFQDFDTKETKTGKIRNDISEIPFFPQWCSNDCLIGSLSMEDYLSIKKEELDYNEIYLNDMLFIFHLRHE